MPFRRMHRVPNQVDGAAAFFFSEVDEPNDQRKIRLDAPSGSFCCWLLAQRTQKVLVRGSDHRDSLTLHPRPSSDGTPVVVSDGARYPEDWWTVPTYPGGSLNAEAAPVEPGAVNIVGPEKATTTSITLTLTIAPNCIEQEGTLESR